MGPDAVHSRDDLGRALTGLRQQAGLSVREVAVDADALLGTVAGWFAGQHAPTSASQAMFLRVLDVCGIADPTDQQQWWSAAQRSAKRSRKRAVPISPYRGFAPYSTADGAWFFGRDELIDRLADMVCAAAQKQAAESADAWLSSVVAVVGSSGVGKSSLVRAGLLPRMGQQEPFEDWQAAVMVPGDDPVGALDAALAELEEHTPRTPSVLVIDQLEELWTQSDPDTRRAVTSRLARMVQDRRAVVVAVLRADFFERAAASPTMATVLATSQLLVPPMTIDQLREVIERPAQVADVAVDEDLITMLLDDVTPASVRSQAAGVGVLPLLSHALRATWEKSDGRRLTVRDYVATGRISGAVEQTAESVFAALDESQQAVARRILLEMVNVDEETVTRRTVRLDDLEDGAGSGDTDSVRAVLEKFAAARLVTLTSSQAQVAHEALLTAWPRLGEWIDADREQLLLRRRLHTLHEQWQADGRPDDLLPARARLEMFAPLIASGVVDSGGRDFLAAGQARVREQDEQERRRARHLRRIALAAGAFGIVAVLAAVIAVVAGVVAVGQKRDADDAKNQALSRQLAIQSADLKGRDPFLAAQLAMIAFQTSPTLDARLRLVDATADGVPTRFLGEAGSLTLARSGALLAAAGGGGQVRLFAVSDKGIERQTADFRAPGGGGRLGGAAFLPGTSTLLLGGQGTLTGWDVSNPAKPVRGTEFPGVRGDVNAITVSPDGRIVVANVTGVGVQAWADTSPAAPSTQPIWQPIPLPDKVAGVSGSAAFSPDGRSLATSSANRRIDLWRIDGTAIVPTGEIRLDEWRDNELAQGLTFMPDGTRLAAALRSHELEIIDVADPANPVKQSELTGFDSYVTAVAVNADGTEVVGAGADNTLRVFDLRSPTAAPRVLTGSSNAVSVFFAGDHVVASSDDGRVQDWPPVQHLTSVGTKSVFQIPADATTSRILAADTGTDGRITQWAVTPQGLRRNGPDLVPPPGTVYSGAVTLSPSGRIATMGTVTGAVQFADVSDPARPRLVGSVDAQRTLNETVDYSERSHLAVTGATDSHVVTIIDASNLAAPKVVSTFDAGGGVWWTSLSPDGATLAVATSVGAVRLLDLSDPVAPKAYPNPITFHGASLAVRFDTNGKRLVATSEERDVVVADVSDPQKPTTVAHLSGPAGQLYSASFSPDGERIIAGGGNSEVWVWRIDGGGDPEVVLRSFPGRVYDVRFAPGDRILAAGGGGAIKTWTIGPQEIIDPQCARPGDQITEAEWRTYVRGLAYRPPCPH